MSARLGALRHDGINSCVYSFARLVQSLHLNDKLRLPVPNSGEKRLEITEREHQRGRSSVEDKIEQMGLTGQRPSDKAHPDPRIARSVKLTFEPVGVSITAADQAQTARPAYCCSKRSAANTRHRCQ